MLERAVAAWGRAQKRYEVDTVQKALHTRSIHYDHAYQKGNVNVGSIKCLNG